MVEVIDKSLNKNILRKWGARYFHSPPLQKSQLMQLRIGKHSGSWMSGNMSKYSWASCVCLRFRSICRNTCIHTQGRSSWAFFDCPDYHWQHLGQRSRSSDLVLRSKQLKPLEAMQPARGKMESETVSPVTELLCEQWLAHARPPPWSEPLLVGGKL